MNFYQSFKLPFPEVVGNFSAKLALTLNLIEPKCGGVLILGEKGTGKSLLLKCFEKFLRIGNFPYIKIPLGVTYEALTGGIDIEKTIEKGKRIYEKGLLEKAEGGFVLVDDINLFPDEYLSLIFEKSEKFTLIATLNPEEGFISSHFLDRFGMCVTTEELKKSEEKFKFLKIYQNFNDFENFYLEDYKNFVKYFQMQRVLKTKLKFDENTLDEITEIVFRESVFSHRAEIFLFYASLSYTAFKGDTFVKDLYIREVAPFVILHRKKNMEEKPQFEEKEQEKKENQEGSTKNFSQSQKNIENRSLKDEDFSKGERQELSELEVTFSSAGKEEIFGIGEIFKPKRLIFKKDRVVRNIIGRRTKSKTKLKGGRFLRSVIFSRDKDIDFFGTIKAAAPFQILRGKKDRLIIKREDFRYKEKERKMGHLIIFLVDGSGSMGVLKRMEAVKGAIFSLLTDCYQKRDKVSMIIFRKNKAEVVLPPTSSVELAYKKLKDLPTGGKTPLSLGFLEAYKLAKKFHLKHPELRIILVCLTDGRANVSLKSGEDPFQEVRRICNEIRNLDYLDKIVIDCEIKQNFLKMELAKDLANWLEGKYFLLEELKAEKLSDLIVNFLS